MAIVRSVIDKLMLRVFGRNPYESAILRRYFDRQYGIKVGLYSIGAFDRWRIPPGTVIGRYCSIAKSARLLDANHPMDALSTHPYFYLKGFGLVGEDRAEVRPPVLEDDVWLGHNCIIAPSCHHIGRGAIVGAGAVVMSDVPPYAIMAGDPARLVRYRFPPQTIAALEQSQWWLLDKQALGRALAVAPGFARAPSPDTALAFLKAANGREVSLSAPEVGVAPARQPPPAPSGWLITVLTQEIPDFTADQADRSFQDLAIDSFGLINIRIAVEQAIGRQIPDNLWGSVSSPADVMRVAASSAPSAATTPSPSAHIAEPAAQEAGPAQPPRAGERRVQHLNMPQMALSGLSEAWAFKEIGDIHWSVLTRGLQTPSAAIADSEGNRLYATFTRISLQADKPLTDFRENDELTIGLDMSRFGAGMFFSRAAIEAPAVTLRAEVMTSFSRFGEHGANTSLLKGQPIIPDDCEIQSLDRLPEFAQAYRARRAEALPDSIFETDYDIIPPHDINGVGLLYFAAYPIIVDICAMRHAGRRLASDYSTVSRDMYYFANCSPDETLLFRLHRWDESDAAIGFDATLSRKSDGKVMAWATTVKQRANGKAEPAKR